MRFFRKLFLSIIIILTLGLAFTEYFIVSLSLESSINNVVDMTVKQHQLVKYAIESDMLSAYTNGQISSEALGTIASNAADMMTVQIKFLHGNSTIISSYFRNTPEFDISSDAVEYRIFTEGDRKYMVEGSCFTQGDEVYTLYTFTDVSYVFENAELMQDRCTILMIIILSAGALFTVFFSYVATKPLKDLSKASLAFAEGDYTKRVRVRTHDEIRDLADTYNKMADMIEDKIRDLELAVKQREDFTSAFAHEMKTPMTSIIGYADTLYQKDLSEDEARNAAGFIVNEGMRLEALSFKLLELMTLKDSDFLLEEINMKDFFKDVEDTVRPASVKKNVKLFFDIEEGYVKIEYDLFKTLIINLIDNAMKSGTSDVAVLSQSKDDKYMIAVVDHGRGIPAKELKRVTEAFYMVDKARSRKEHGAGLGLALCDKIAAIHGTHLDIRSRENEGTAIRILLKKEITDPREDDADT